RVAYCNLFNCTLSALSDEMTKLFSKLKVWFKHFANLCWNWRHVYSIHKRLITKNVKHLLGNINRNVFLCFYSGSAKMRRYDNIRMIQEWMICSRGLYLEYVKCSTCNNSLIDCFNECALINNSTASAVHNTHARLHYLEL